MRGVRGVVVLPVALLLVSLPIAATTSTTATGAAAATTAVAAATITATATTPHTPQAHEVCRVADARVIESSGLVELEEGWVTTNDSGDDGRLFLLDPATCAVLREVDWSAGEPTDVEALAPAGPGEVWVGDIGDNQAERDDITLTRVSLADGAARERRVLRYPDGPHDAEALLRHPETGQLFIATKSVFGGTLYAAPATGRTLQPVGPVTGLVTDGAFLTPDLLIVRTYTQAIRYSFPELTELDRIDLPDQEQGEAIAASSSAEVLISSEGRDQPVWRLALPRRPDQPALQSTQPPEPTQPPTRPSDHPTDGINADASAGRHDPATPAWPTAIATIAALTAIAAAAAAAAAAIRAAKRRRRR